MFRVLQEVVRNRKTLCRVSNVMEVIPNDGGCGLSTARGVVKRGLLQSSIARFYVSYLLRESSYCEGDVSLEDDNDDSSYRCVLGGHIDHENMAMVDYTVKFPSSETSCRSDHTFIVDDMNSVLDFRIVLYDLEMMASLLVRVLEYGVSLAI